jgi:acyl-homoserine lactone acylase PvdQ
VVISNRGGHYKAHYKAGSNGAAAEQRGSHIGNPLSPHYDDLFMLWQRGEGVPIAWAPEDVRKAARATLRLQVVT